MSIATEIAEKVDALAVDIANQLDQTRAAIDSLNLNVAETEQLRASIAGLEGVSAKLDQMSADLRADDTPAEPAPEDPAPVDEPAQPVEGEPAPDQPTEPTEPVVEQPEEPAPAPEPYQNPPL